MPLAMFFYRMGGLKIVFVFLFLGKYDNLSVKASQIGLGCIKCNKSVLIAMGKVYKMKCRTR